mgnify:CR=1 FL=1
MMIKNVLFLLLLIQTVASCQPPNNNNIPSGESYDPPNSTDTRTKPIDFQHRKTFKVKDIYVSNEFYGARLSDIKLDSEVENGLIATISPENAPINQSSWYAFRIWSDSKQEVTIKLVYPNGKHRYYPKLSIDGTNWKKIESFNYKNNRKEETADITLKIGPLPLWVAAQELRTTKDVFHWMDSLEAFPHIYGDTVGYSRLGKPLRALRIAENNSSNVIIAMTRQHPPETTGQLAFDAFIETILDSNNLANRFRQHFQIYAFPMVNPDGVDQGHWRHNAGGIDLNRDWWEFRQPEIKYITEYLTGNLLNDSTKVWYGFDFHSTGSDILYPISNEIVPDDVSITKLWIDNMKIRLPNDEWKIEPFDISSPISKNWIYRTFNAEAITYEVGDSVSKDYVKLKARIAAEEMMRILLTKIGQ